MTITTNENLRGLGKQLTYLQEVLSHWVTCSDCMKPSAASISHRRQRLKLLH